MIQVSDVDIAEGCMNYTSRVIYQIQIELTHYLNSTKHDSPS